MKLTIRKTINEQIAEQKTMADNLEPAKETKEKIVEVGKEANFKDAEEQHKKAEAAIAKAMEPAEKAVKDIVDLTSSKESRTRTAKKLVKDRKELASLIKEAKTKNQVYTISRSLTEGFRYEIIIKDDLKEGAEGKQAPEGYKWVLYCEDETSDKYDTIVAVRNSYTEAHYFYLQNLDKDLGVELVDEKDAVVGKDIKTCKFYNNSDKNNTVDEKLKEPVSDDKKTDIKLDTDTTEKPDTTPTPDTTDAEKPISDNIVPVEPVAIPEPEQVTPEQKQAAIESMINTLISDEFKNIDELKSIIASIEYQGGNDEIVTILNSVNDDTTVNIGMLQKALSIVAPQTDKNIQAGQEKAETITNDDLKADKKETEEEKAEKESPKDESLKK
jgi:hypothetical protein